MTRKREEKISTGYTVKADAESGVLKSYVSIFGIEDDSWMNDVIEPGAFKRTIAERGPSGVNKIRVLWMHSFREVIGKCLSLEEHPRDLLPEHVRERYPLASGGLYAETKLVLGVQRGREAFELYKEGAMDEWSIGFDPIDERFETIDKRTIRHLKEIKLWEYSPVTWGANPATATVEVKQSSIVALLDELQTNHPEYSERQLLHAAEQRLKLNEPFVPTQKPTFLSDETLALFEAIKAEHADYTELQIIQAVEERLSPKQVIEPEPTPQVVAPPLVNLDNWKRAASRRNELLRLELLLRGHHA